MSSFLRGSQTLGKSESLSLYESESESVHLIDQLVYADFRFIYEESKHLEYLEQNQSLYFPKGIPVFFTMKGQKVLSIGLSQMFKLAYKNSIHHGIRNISRNHLDPSCRDLSDLIFGYVNDSEGELGLKGRASFSHAVCLQSSPKTTSVETILNGPKASYYPNYIEQNEEKGKVERYKTFMDDDAKIRGWKRYPVRSDATPPVPDVAQGPAVRSRITAIVERVKFNGKMRFHNLRRFELGALLWVMEWGGNEELCHTIGMGKPFGYGKIRLRIKEEEVSIYPNDTRRECPDLVACKDEFISKMCEIVGPGWVDSEQIIQLMMMADENQAPGDSGLLAHMDLPQFARVKGPTQQDHHLALMPYRRTPAKNPYVSVEFEASVAQEWFTNNLSELVERDRSSEEQVLYGKGLATR